MHKLPIFSLILFFSFACSSKAPKNNLRTASNSDKSPGQVKISERKANFDLAGVSPRIIGGAQAPETEYKFLANIHVEEELYQNNSSGTYTFLCGGTLISQNIVLTAAHCVEPYRDSEGYYSQDNVVDPGEFVTINARENSGFPYFRGPYTGPLAVSMEIESVHMHPDYRVTWSGEPVNDLAVIVLKGTVRQSLIDLGHSGDEIEPVELADENFEIATGSELKIAGFGTTESGSVSQFLLDATVNYIPNESCGYGSAVTSDMMCAAARGRDTCQGDSGGPLLYESTNGNPILVGVTSWGIGCANPNYAGVYSRVSHNHSWISQFLPAEDENIVSIYGYQKYPTDSLKIGYNKVSKCEAEVFSSKSVKIIDNCAALKFDPANGTIEFKLKSAEAGALSTQINAVSFDLTTGFVHFPRGTFPDPRITDDQLEIILDGLKKQ